MLLRRLPTSLHPLPSTQAFSRQFHRPVDTLGISYTVLDPAVEIGQGPKAGVYVYGLHTDSCRWSVSDQQLDECMQGTMYGEMPVIHFLPEENHSTPEVLLAPGPRVCGLSTPPPREVLEWPYTIGGGYPPPPDIPLPDQSDHRGKKRQLPFGKSGHAIFRTQKFWSQTQGCIGRGRGGGGVNPPTLHGAPPMPGPCPPDGKCQLPWHLAFCNRQ